jgi:preprotein translocase subunit SecB
MVSSSSDTSFDPDNPSANMQFSMITQYVKDLSFENPRAPDSLQKMQAGKPDIKISVNINAKKMGEEGYEVALSLSATAKVEKETMFIAELNYGALFGVRNVPEDQLQPLLLIECPRLMFPYARRIFADAVRDGGFPPIMLDPIDFTALFQQQQQGAGENVLPN